MSNGNCYTVHAYSASGALLGLDGPESAGKPREGLTGHDAGQCLNIKSGHRRAEDGRAVRNTVRFFVVTEPNGRQTSHGRDRGRLVHYLSLTSAERYVFDIHAKATGKPAPWDPNRPGAVRAPQETAEPVKAPAPRTSATESPRSPRATVKTSTGAESVNATTAERLTVNADNAKGEPVYVKTLPERHPVHPGKTVREVFGHDGYWFTVPGDFPASLPDEFRVSRATYAVFQSPDVVPGALVWVVRGTNGSIARLGQSTESRRAAVREALEVQSRYRMMRAHSLVKTRAELNGRPVPAPVRVSAGDAGWVVHIRCACEDVTSPEDFPSVARAARDWIDADPGTPWELCPHSPGAFVTIAGIRYTITGPGRAGPYACLYGLTDDGHTGYMWLRDARDNTI